MSPNTQYTPEPDYLLLRDLSPGDLLEYLDEVMRRVALAALIRDHRDMADKLHALGPKRTHGRSYLYVANRAEKAERRLERMAKKTSDPFLAKHLRHTAQRVNKITLRAVREFIEHGA